MKSTAVLASVALLLASASTVVLASDHDRDHDHQRSTQVRTTSATRTGTAMRPVFNRAAPGEQAHGWRYYSDPAAVRAVVISPQGDYYLNGGEGLRRVTRTPSGA